MNKQKHLSDEELHAIIKKEKNRKGKGRLVFMLGVIITISFIYFTSPKLNNVVYTTLLGICIGVMFLGFCIICAAEGNTKRNVGVQLISIALNEVFENVHYNANARVADSLIIHAAMAFPFRCDEIAGNDLVQATYKGIDIMMSDITIIKVERTTTQDGKTRITRETQFAGLWLICDFRKKLSTKLSICERSTWGKAFARGGVKTDSESFNNQFCINCDNPHEVFYVLTPHMMEYIQAMDKKAHGDTHICVLREGKIHIAINSNRNAFEVTNLNTTPAELRERFVNEIRYITDLIDELRLVDTLFEENIK